MTLVGTASPMDGPYPGIYGQHTLDWMNCFNCGEGQCTEEVHGVVGGGANVIKEYCMKFPRN